MFKNPAAMRFKVTKPCHRAGVTDPRITTASKAGERGHKALSPGRCDGHERWFGVEILSHKSQSPVTGQV